MKKVSKCEQCDWRAESLQVVRTEEWDEVVGASFGNTKVVVANFAPVYKVKVVCKVCANTKYVEKICYNQEEIPEIGKEIRNSVDAN